MNAKRVFQLGSCFAIAGLAITAADDASAQACTPNAPATNSIADYKDPNASAKSCTAADLQAVEAEIAKGNSKFVDLETFMKARNVTCASCMFTKEADATWGPLVYVGNAGGALQYYGACFARAPGGSVACGKAVQATFDCLDAVCDETACGGQAQVSACTKTALADPSSCGKFNLGASCPNLDQLFNSCEKFTGVLEVMCGGAVPNSSSSGSSGASSSGSSGASSSGSTSSSSGGTSSSSGSSGKSSTSSSGNANPDDTGTTSSTTSSCSTTGVSDNGSLVAALALVGAGVLGVSRRRKKNERAAS